MKTILTKTTKHSARNLLFIILLISLISCETASVGPTESCTNTKSFDNNSHPKNVLLTSMIEDYVKKGIPGLSVLIRDHNGLWAYAYGKADIENKINFSVCTISKTGSITKIFIGLVVLQMAEEGKLMLDDPAEKYLDNDIVNHVENLKGSTIRMLMNHSTGIYDLISDTEFYLEVLNNPDKHWTQEELIKKVYHKKANFKQGEKHAYSNTNTLLLSMIIDKVAGRSHALEIRQRILEPLGLSNTYYFWHDPLPSTTAQGYYDLYNNGTIINVTNYHTGSGNGYTGIYSNLFDLQIYAEMLFKDKVLLSENYMQEMLTFHKAEGESSEYGLCCFKEFADRKNPDEYALGHRGGDLGYAAELLYFPVKDITFIMMMNYGTNGTSAVGDYYQELRLKLIDLILE